MKTILWIIIYSAIFAMASAWALVWILERKDKRYGQGGTSFTDAAPVGAFFMATIFISDVVALLNSPGAAVFYNLALIAGLGFFMLWRESGYRARENLIKKKLRIEIRVLEKHALIDPSNAALHERLSEIHERLGEKEKAMESARLASKLDPNVRNSWRIKDLE